MPLSRRRHRDMNEWMTVTSSNKYKKHTPNCSRRPYRGSEGKLKANTAPPQKDSLYHWTVLRVEVPVRFIEKVRNVFWVFLLSLSMKKSQSALFTFDYIIIVSTRIIRCMWLFDRIQCFDTWDIYISAYFAKGHSPTIYRVKCEIRGKEVIFHEKFPVNYD